VLRRVFCLLVLVFPPRTIAQPHYQYFRAGQSTEVETKPSFGIALMGGGPDLDEAFRWLCEKANGGDFLILRASGDDAYNAYVNGLCKLNSVATLIIPDRNTAQDPAVADIIRHAKALFISGGDQARYVRAWRGTAVQAAINSYIADAKPVGGTSAGLAVLGKFSYAALNDPPDGMLSSSRALQDPFTDQVTLVRNFITVPLLRDTLTDSHFAKRDRLGRSLVFLARLIQDGWTKTPREIAVDEKSAVLIESGGTARVVGSGQGTYFLHPTQAPAVCRRGIPLSFFAVSVYKAPAGSHFDLSTWTGAGGVGYTVDVKDGAITSTRSDHSLY
jgi:cyanophycinase